ncbi:hypothetical protein JYU15_00605, partial [bacterium AH-315-I18]|nr:hypothetical protein [bacterium AH-315-I18]
MKRLSVPVVYPRASANIVPRYAIESAAWVGLPNCPIGQTAFLEFRNRFVLKQEQTIEFHVSADHRYELFCEGQFVSMGPDRGDEEHWSFASYRMTLAAGEHEFLAKVWWLGQDAPFAQRSYRCGFIFAADIETLNTGAPTWQVRQIQGISFENFKYQVTGPGLITDAKEYFSQTQPWHTPEILIAPMIACRGGTVRSGWKLEPSGLPDMLRKHCSLGKVRAVVDGPATQQITKQDCHPSQLEDWQKLLETQQPVIIPPHTQVSVIIDLQNYYCGYSQLKLSGGKTSKVTWHWAESLYLDAPQGSKEPCHKGNRDEVVEKYYFGCGDSFLNDGQPDRNYQSHWWRAGRYWQLSITTQDNAVQIESINMIETRYPLEDHSQWISDDPQLDAVVPIAVRGLQMCCHETFMDCPFYEQLMYVGDTRVQMLIWYVINDDDHLARRAIELFDFSRWKTGYVAERYPSEPFQLSTTFSMIWVLMLHDYAWWRDDSSWIRRQLVGLRSLLEQFFMHIEGKELLNALPGWSFMDWVPQWDYGNAPDGKDGISSVNNLLFIYALKQAAKLENQFGEPLLAQRYNAMAQRLAKCVIEQFWDDKEGCLADDLSHEHYSEHAQCLSLLSDVLDEQQTQSSLKCLLDSQDMAKATIYFSFYLLEVFNKFNCGHALCEKLDFWKHLPSQGL